MNSVKKACLVWLTFVIFFIHLPISVHSQSLPDRNNFNFVFENNFNDNHSGNYLESEFIEDWNLPGGNKPFGNLEIFNDDALHQKVMRAYFPTGTLNASEIHGFTWYSYLTSKLNEIYFSYDVRFKPGFQWVLGGKIPGLVGGSVTSGQLPTFNSGFSTRLVWKSGGTLLFYVYHHDQKDIYGDIYDFNGFRFETGRWYNLTMRIVLNTVSNGSAYADGILEGYIDGTLMFQKTGFRFRLNENIKIERMYICSFFGGNTDDWAADRDEWIDTDNYLAYTYSENIQNVPRGLQASPPSRQLIHPYINLADNEWKNSFNSNGITKTSVNLAWKDYPVPVTYLLERREAESSVFTPVASLAYNTRAFVDNNLKAGYSYVYRLKAGNSFSETTITTLNPQIPNAPTSLIISGHSKSAISINWKDNSNNESGFIIERSLTSSSGFVKVGNVQANITAFADISLQPGTTYYYRLNAINTDGASEYTSVLEAKTDPLQIPEPPTGLIASAISYNSASVLWTDNANNEVSFDMERCGPTDYSIKEILVIPGNSVTFTDTGLIMNSSYRFRIRSKNEDGASAWSNQIEVITPILYPPETPTKLKSTKFTNETISVSWVDNSNNEDGFIITRSLAIDSSSGVAIQIKANDTSFTDTSLVAGTTYQYIIKAVNFAGSSSRSNKNVATTLSLAELKRCKEGLIAYYNFGYNPDYIVYDQSGYDEPLNLGIIDRSAVRWQENNTISILSNTALVSITAATKVVRAIKKTNELTFECWIKPREPDFPSDARIISLSSNNDDIGFILDQEYHDEKGNQSLTYTVRMQTESTISSGYPEFKPECTQQYINMQHLVYSRDKTGNESLYLNGIKTSSGYRPNDLCIWKDNYYLRLGNESDMFHSWKGDYHTVALFNRVLTADQVLNNYAAGPCDHIHLNDIDYSVEFYPNPIIDEAYIKITPNNVVDLSPQTFIRISDIFGRPIFQERVFNPNLQYTTKLDFKKYEPGTYFLQVISGKKQKTEKVIVLE